MKKKRKIYTYRVYSNAEQNSNFSQCSLCFLHSYQLETRMNQFKEHLMLYCCNMNNQRSCLFFRPFKIRISNIVILWSRVVQANTFSNWLWTEATKNCTVSTRTRKQTYAAMCHLPLAGMKNVQSISRNKMAFYALEKQPWV